MRTKRILFVILSILGTLVVALYTNPATQHYIRALIHRHPKIDHYKIFENRTVEAGTPQPWKFSHDYGVHGIDASFIDRFAELQTVAYVVIQDDSIIFERYWDGYGPDSYSNSFSMAKSIVSLLVGIAIGEGKIESLDQPVKELYPWINNYNGKVMTIEHLLTMSAGIDWDENYAGLLSPTTKAYYGKDLDIQVLKIQSNDEPGVRFRYQSGVTQILAEVLERAVKMNISGYASEKLWKPMGAEYDALWSLDRKNGTEKAYCCFNSNARDFARFGKLMLGGGRWDGLQLIPEEYMEKALSPATWLLSEDGTTQNDVYGYQFWILQKEGMQIPYMRGILGQYVFAIPDQNAVIVRLGRKRSDVRTAQNYPDDIDTWLEAGLSILRNRGNNLPYEIEPTGAADDRK